MTWLLKLREERASRREYDGQRRPGLKYGVEEFLEVKYGIDRKLQLRLSE